MFRSQSFIPCILLLMGIGIMPDALCQRFTNTADTTTYALYDTPIAPEGVVLANLNNDAFPDMAIISRAENVVSIQYNDRTGRFGPAVTYRVGNNPQSIAAADLNNDGRIDLIISSQIGTTSVLLNSASGLTGVSDSYPSTVGSSYLAIADFNGDNRPDIVNGGGWGEYRILTNNGGGSFTSGQATSMPNGVAAITAADFDGDSRPDLAIAGSSSSTVRILRNTGSNTFSQIGLYTMSTSLFSMVAGDVNSDGRPDLLIGSWSLPKEVGVLSNMGNGQFGNYYRIDSVGFPFGIAFNDISGDGIPDLLVSNGSLQTYILVWPGRGDGTFKPATRYQTGAGPSLIAVADLNADIRPDVAIINRDNSTATILIRGQGRFGSASIITGEAQVSILADTDRDGYADLIGLRQDTTYPGTSYYDQALLVYHNRHDGTFDPPRYQSILCEPNTLAKGDLNNDGWVDLVSTNYNGNTIAVLLNNRQGLFSPPVKYSTGEQATQPRSSELVDVNNDGFLDIITQNNGTSLTSIAVFINQGDGTFSPPIQYPQNYDSIQDFTVSDFNGDDRPDIAVLIFRANPNRLVLVRLYLNNGDGSFTVMADKPLPKEAGTIISYDVNMDGNMDLLLGYYLNPGTEFMQNNGSGVFADMQRLIPDDFGPMFTDDLNGDGLADLCILLSSFPQDNAKQAIAVRLNDGAGGFTSSFQLPLGFFESLSTDVNGDGRPDILTGATSGMYIWYNQTPTVPWGITTAQPGSWNIPQTWTGNRIPLATDHVLIRHPVQLPAGYTGRATRVGFDLNGQLQYNSNARLGLQKHP